MATERTFLAIKPDGVQRRLVGLKQLTPSRELAEQHYGVHREGPFFAGLVEFITSGPVVAMVWEGEGVIAAARVPVAPVKPGIPLSQLSSRFCTFRCGPARQRW